MTAVEKLDNVLDYLSKKQNNSASSRNEIINHLNSITKITNNEVEKILLKLIKDKYADKNEEKPNLPSYDKNDGKIFYSTFEGDVFCEKGGYKQENINATSETQRIESLERNTYRATFWMAVGAVGLLVIEVVKFYLNFCH